MQLKFLCNFVEFPVNQIFSDLDRVWSNQVQIKETTMQYRNIQFLITNINLKKFLSAMSLALNR